MLNKNSNDSLIALFIITLVIAIILTHSIVSSYRNELNNLNEDMSLLETKYTYIQNDINSIKTELQSIKYNISEIDQTVEDNYIKTFKNINLLAEWLYNVENKMYDNMSY